MIWYDSITIIIISIAINSTTQFVEWSEWMISINYRDAKSQWMKVQIRKIGTNTTHWQHIWDNLWQATGGNGMLIINVALCQQPSYEMLTCPYGTSILYSNGLINILLLLLLTGSTCIEISSSCVTLLSCCTTSSCCCRWCSRWCINSYGCCSRWRW